MAVTVISTIHVATDAVTKKEHTRENVIKPEDIFSYTNLMNRINLSDQYFDSYSLFKKSMT